MNITDASIWGVLNKDDRKRFMYVKPNNVSGITLLYETSTPESPGTKQLAVCRLELAERYAIPFHRHPHKEKLYRLDEGQSGGVGCGCIEVLMYEDAELKKYLLKSPGQQLVVPAATTHAVICLGVAHRNKTCSMLVIASSRDATTDWEPGADELILNRHLTPD